MERACACVCTGVHESQHHMPAVIVVFTVQRAHSNYALQHCKSVITQPPCPASAIVCSGSCGKG
eukprot:1161280-Pelagomonas_calceolata.AAC.7